MRDALNVLSHYHLPRYKELPDIGLFSRQVIQYINDILGPILIQDSQLTATMIQNYVKLEIMPSPSCRRYNREHIAHIIAITILKHVIPIKQVRRGIDLAMRHGSISVTYDAFAEALEEQLHRTVLPVLVKKKTYHFEAYDLSHETTGLTYACLAYSHLLVLDLLLATEGLQGLNHPDENHSSTLNLP
ncbi:DUF1836 domain-containing protein [Atopobacter sp. AH10]|uniref:DUF1836 domain-containing protein n=1 Tax=Atopobacter sp. AH10 TaxID=2315861 RepID=UPI000EF255F4|nr:DUF1836 domain-containing protein [Atopobacter sp. AH10]RLK62580.1 DUF1836 domain-containing protein [Atopobacter sp. AH10]